MPRHVTVVRTYLHLSQHDRLNRGAPPTVEAELVRMAPCSVTEWRDLYREIGEPWHWHDRDVWSDAQLSAHLRRADVLVYRVLAPTLDATRPAGFLELEHHDDNSVEVVYLGLHRRAFGRGLGRWLVAAAADEAWRLSPTRVWLHTCTLDGDAALPNYLARGFEVERQETYEVVLD